MLIGEQGGKKQKIIETLNESFEDDEEHDSEGEVSDNEVNKDYFFNTNEANESMVKKISSTHRHQPSIVSSAGYASNPMTIKTGEAIDVNLRTPTCATG